MPSECGWCGEDPCVCGLPVYDEDDDDRCSRCGGDGWVECSDPMECTTPHNEYDECQCSSCGGTGQRKDMTIW